ncbi:MAG: HEAT repeat domain-containing protein, partial [Planctomycetota bacterium]
MLDVSIHGRFRERRARVHAAAQAIAEATRAGEPAAETGRFVSDPHDEDLATLVAEAAEAPLSERTPVLGLLLDGLDADSPQLRVACVHALRGADGPLAWAAIARCLNDPATEVRARAVESLAESANTSDAWRFVHAVFHARVDVRRHAVSRIPADIRGQILIHLLADPDLRPALATELDAAYESGKGVRLVLHAVEHGYLTPREARAAVLRMPWATSPGLMFDDLPALPTLPALSVRHEALAKEVAAQAFGEDALDKVLALVWIDLTGEVERGKLFELLRQACARGALSQNQGARLAWSILRVARQYGGMTPAKLALAARAAPAALMDHLLEVDIRKMAARRLHGFVGTSTCPRPFETLHAQPEATPWWAHPLLQARKGDHLDLAVVAGIAWCAKTNPLEVVRAAFTEDEVLRAARLDPDGAMALLLFQANGATRAFYDRLVAAVTSPAEASTAERIADLFARVPV